MSAAKRLGLLLITVAGTLLFCSNNTNIAGSGSQTETAKIRGSLVALDGSPGSGVQVYLRPTDYLPGISAKVAARFLFKTLDSIYTDSLGRFAFDSLATGTYMLECLDGEDGNGALIDSVVVAHPDSTIELASDTLKPLGSIAGQIQLPESLDVSRIRVMVYGLDRVVAPDSTGQFAIPGLPEGRYDLRIVGPGISADLAGNRGAEVTAGQTTNLPASLLTLNEHGLVGYWPFDENSGQFVYDASGYSNTGFLGTSSTADSVDPVWAPGKIGSCLQFDSTNNSRVIVDAVSSSLDSLTSFTYTAWINPTSYGENYGRVLSREAGIMDEFYIICFNGAYYRDFGASLTDVTDSTYETNTDSNTISLNAWQHVAVTYEDTGARTIHIYINGVETVYRNRETVLAQLRLSSNPLVIGNSLLGGKAFIGKIDEVKVYNRVLSQHEIVSEMNRQ